MKKALAEAIAALIPHKMTRNRCRGILRYGVRKAMELRRELKEEHPVPKHYLSVCAVVKNEAPYFKEWIEWHTKIGVEKFYIYDNDSTDNTREVLEPYIEKGLVEYKYWPGRKQQLAVYDDCIDSHRYDSRWIAIIDLDEFLFPVVDKSMVTFLERLENFSSVEINWLVYGSSGKKMKEPGDVMQRFKAHALSGNPINRYVKSIVNPRKVYCMIGAHESARIEGLSCNADGVPNKKSFRDRIPTHVTARINHYPLKSYEEFLEKRSRGRVRTNEVLDQDYITRFDFNDEVD